MSLVLALGQYSPTLLLVLMPLLLVFTGLIYGIDCAVRVGSTIAKEHEKDTFNLLSLSPCGALGTSWAICTSALYRNRDFERLHTIMRASILIAIIAIVVTASLVMLVQSDDFTRFPKPRLPTFTHMIDLIAVMLALYIEYIQSAILGSLVGMTIPTYTQNRLDTSLYAFGGFLLLQITTYFLAYLIGFVILPNLYDRLQIISDYNEISLSILRLGIFFMVRELIVSILWRTLTERLNAQPSDLELAMQLAP